MSVDKSISRWTPTRVAQLVRANTEKCGSNKWHMILVLNPTIDDTLNLPGASFAGQSAPRGLGPHREF